MPWLLCCVGREEDERARREAERRQERGWQRGDQEAAKSGADA